MPQKAPLSSLSPDPPGLVEDQPGTAMNEDYLTDTFRKIYQVTNRTPADQMPNVAPPAIFEKDPLVVDSAANAKRIYQTVARVAPMYLDKIRMVSRAPTGASMRLMSLSGLDPMTTGGTNLRGLTAGTDKDTSIFIAPDVPNLLRVLIHELAHVAGGDEAIAHGIGKQGFK